MRRVFGLMMVMLLGCATGGDADEEQPTAWLAEAQADFIREEALGKNLLVATSLSNLARLYTFQGSYDRAEPLYLRALAIHEATLGKRHPFAIFALSNLANLYTAQGLYDRAEPLHLRALATAEATLGDVVPPLNNLANHYASQGLNHLAEPLYQRALATAETTFGKSHPGLVDTLHNLARLRLTQHRLASALPLLTRAFAISEQFLRQETLGRSESHISILLQALRRGAEHALYALLRAYPGDPRVQRLALSAVLLRKGRSVQETADISRTLYQHLGAEDRDILERLRGLRTQLATLSLSGPGSRLPSDHQQRLKSLADESNSLETELAKRSAPLRALTTLPPPAEIVDRVAASLPRDSVLYVQLEQALPPGQCVTRSVPASAQLPPDAQGDGAYYLAAAVDTNHAEQELREDNNVHVSGLMGVGNRSDLVVTGVNAPASVTPGQSFTASVKVCNQGKSPSYGGASYGPGVELFLSMDTELSLPSPGTPSPVPGTQLDQVSIGYLEVAQSLNPGECVTKDVPAQATLPPAAQGAGAYYLVAAVDMTGLEQELREDNNVHVGGLLGVGYRADLVVTEVSAPASIGHGQPFTASVKVCNQGTTPLQGYAGAPRVELFLSVDATVSMPSMNSPSPGMPMEQLSIGFVDLTEPLNPAQCVTKAVPASASLPPAAQGDGAYYLAAAIDTGHAEQELREDNNVHVKGLMGVGSRPDLVVTEVSGPASVHHGQAFTASVKVCNQGTAPSMDTAWLMVLLSTDAQLSLPYPGSPPPADQMKIGGIDVAPLPAGQCVTKDIPAYASLPAGAPAPGVFHLGAIIDANLWVQELREDNNLRADTTLEVTD